jgi:uncharacterized protein YrrD
MFTGESLIGRRVLARQEGQMLDSVKDVVIDTAQRRVVAFLIHEGRLFSAPTVVPLEKVTSIGDDAVVVTDAASAVAVDQYPMVKDILDRDDRLVGKAVYTDSGNVFGKVVDVEFELPTGNIVEIKVSSHSDDDRPVAIVAVPVAEIVSIGPQAVVISRSHTQTEAATPGSSTLSPDLQDAPPTTRIGDDVDSIGVNARGGFGNPSSPPYAQPVEPHVTDPPPTGQVSGPDTDEKTGSTS